jgi:hypothetical protein
MTDVISVSFTGLDSLMVHLQEMPAAIRRNLAAVVTKESLRLETVVKDEKLTGQVLANRTGRLRSSIHSQVEITDTAVTGAVFANMSQAAYARFWEYGFSGTEQVREHLRHMTAAFARPLATPRDVLVKAHTRRVEQPARSYLRSTLEENRDVLVTRIEGAVEQGLKA